LDDKAFDAIESYGVWELWDSDDSYKSIIGLAVVIARTEGWREQEELWKACSVQLANRAEGRHQQKSRQAHEPD
jgi:hypothetical protein